MKTVGLLGGMSWESSAEYYAILNREVRARAGATHSARCLMLSVDFAEFRALMERGDWEALGARLAEEAQALERGGAECVVLCTNTMHFAAERIAAAIGVPFLDIFDVTATAVRAAGLRRVGLLGTGFTMERPFYRERLESHGLEVLVPEANERARLHAIIFDELVTGTASEASREAMRTMIAALAARGAQGVILGCTELMLLADGRHAIVPLFDTTALHAVAAIDFALG